MANARKVMIMVKKKVAKTKKKGTTVTFDYDVGDRVMLISDKIMGTINAMSRIHGGALLYEVAWFDVRKHRQSEWFGGNEIKNTKK